MRNLHDILRNEKNDVSVLKKKKKKKDDKMIFLNFSEMEKYGLFWAKKLMEMWYLLITEKFLFRIFQEWEIRPLFEPKSWCKDDICWLLKISFFELFGDGKYGLFSAKKLIERWYLLNLFELSVILRDFFMQWYIIYKPLKFDNLGIICHFYSEHSTSEASHSTVESAVYVSLNSNFIH